jgi:hypothetical protein
MQQKPPFQCIKKRPEGRHFSNVSPGFSLDNQTDICSTAIIHLAKRSRGSGGAAMFQDGIGPKLTDLGDFLLVELSFARLPVGVMRPCAAFAVGFLEVRGLDNGLCGSIFTYDDVSDLAALLDAKDQSRGLQVKAVVCDFGKADGLLHGSGVWVGELPMSK